VKSILGVDPKVKDWEAFVLGYTLESKVRPLHQGYVSVTTLYLALSTE
jgi:hypothetical protein